MLSRRLGLYIIIAKKPIVSLEGFISTLTAIRDAKKVSYRRSLLLAASLTRTLPI